MSISSISRVTAREILNGIGNPTIEVDVVTREGWYGRGSVPSGASMGSHEAWELRDGGERYLGKGVLKAVSNVNQVIGPALGGMEVTRQRQIDEIMLALDGTANKSNLGANAILAVSIAVADAAARASGLPLYRYLGGDRPYFLPSPGANLIAGGKHAGNHLDFEDHLIFATEGMSFREGTRACVEVHHQLGSLLEDRCGPQRVVGGAFAPNLDTEEEALDLIMEAVRRSGHEGNVVLGLDVAATLFYSPNSGRYCLATGEMTRDELIEYYRRLVGAYPLRVIEDPLNEDDFEGFSQITRSMDLQIVGDDLFTTNQLRLEEGIAQGAANSLLLKINQVGTLTETLDTAATATRAGYSILSSVRSGECEDTAAADVAVAVGARQIKLGAPVRGERNSKYNRLLRIEEELLTGQRVP